MAKLGQVLINRVLDVDAVAARSQSFESRALWTFAAGAESSHLPTAFIRFFKDLRRTPHHPFRTQVCRSLAELVARAAEAFAPTHVCRALGSWEMRPEELAPLEALACDVATLLKASALGCVRRTAPRPTMSLQEYLSGSVALRRRIRFASQDLVFGPMEELSGARVLFLDDVRCIGATEALFAWMLEEFAGVSAVLGVNLGQMEGLGSGCDILEVSLDSVSGQGEGFFERCWMDSAHRFHKQPACASLSSSSRPWWAGLAGDPNRWCTECAKPQTFVGRLQSIFQKKR
ncbi:MAG: hypothetical protein IT209_05360 [Armatimonadetes bacterium]|nr:hypothetical protein [Armatimonadota bacterium]